MFVALLQGSGLKTNELELALFLRFQGVAVFCHQSLATTEIDVKRNIQEKEKEIIKREGDNQMNGISFVNYDDNIGIEDDVKQDPTYLPTTDSETLAAIYPCEQCGKHFKSLKKVEAHSKKHLQVEEKSCKDNSKTVDRALCNVCSKSFANKYILKSHMQTHSEETETVELVSCNICKKSFRNKYNLKYHKKSHDADVKEKAMALCNQCSKIVTKNKLKKHMKNIHGEKKIANCSNCGISSRISCIENHERMCKLSDKEREARKIKCDECGKSLSSRDKLRRHRRNIHPIEQAQQEMKHNVAKLF